jgi:hypothetical protein
MDLTNPQIIIRDKEIARLKEELSDREDDIRTEQLWVTHWKEELDCTKDILEQTRTQLAAAQATIEQMREALERCTKFTQEDYDALTLQPCPEVLNKVRADAAMAAISWVWSQGSVLPREAYSYVKRIERGEA